MSAEKHRCPSPLQRRGLIVLAALNAKRPGPVVTRDIERVLERGEDVPVYGPNLRASCRRMEAAGWLHTLRAPNLQLAVELTDAGRELAAPLLAVEQERELAERRATESRFLPLVPVRPVDTGDFRAGDRPVRLDDIWYMACRGDYVIRADGTTCLQLWNTAGQVTRPEGDAVQVALWQQTCHDAGIEVRLQINESHAPEEGCISGTAQVDQTEVWVRQLDAELQKLGITGLTETDRQAVVVSGETLRSLPAPARLLHILRESVEAFPLTVSRYETDAGDALDALQARAGFSASQAQELRWHCIRWPLMRDKEFEQSYRKATLVTLACRCPPWLDFHSCRKRAKPLGDSGGYSRYRGESRTGASPGNAAIALSLSGIATGCADDHDQRARRARTAIYRPDV